MNGAFFMGWLRQGSKIILNAFGLLRPLQRFLARRVRRDPLESLYSQRFLQFKRQYGKVLRHRLNTTCGERKIALVSSPPFPEVEIHLALIKALELCGFSPVVLIPRGGRFFFRYYRLAGVKKIHFWNEFLDSPDHDLGAADDVIKRLRSVEELVTFEYAAARVGRLAVSSALRQLKLGSLDLDSAQCRQRLVNCLAGGMAYAKAAQTIVRTFRPQLALLMDTAYTPEGELFDNCLLNGIETIVWQAGHKSNSLMFKRYTLQNRDEHPCFLSSESWERIRCMAWTDADRDQLQDEIYSNYANGDWYSIAGTQFHKRFMSPENIRTRLPLDPAKKTAFIFPNIPWDASLSWVKCLFRNYEEWFVETVRAACANDQVNWVIKIHPANIGKRVREGYQEEIAEVAALRTHIGRLPPHIYMIAAETDISTLSLFGLMDYCLTVSGTVGLEAARLGIPVLTGGTAPYTHKGLTIDSVSREEYLEKVAHIHHIPPLSRRQQELAERFAYGVFLLRPLQLVTATLEYHNNHEKFSTTGRINVSTKEEWYDAPDLRAFAHWVNNSRKTDFLWSATKQQPFGLP